MIKPDMYSLKENSKCALKTIDCSAFRFVFIKSIPWFHSGTTLLLQSDKFIKGKTGGPGFVFWDTIGEKPKEG